MTEAELNERYPWITPAVALPVQGPLLDGLVVLTRAQHRELYRRIQPDASPALVEVCFGQYITAMFGDAAFGPKVGGLPPPCPPDRGYWQ